MDNFYANCPAKMDDARFLTNYKSSSSNNEYIKYKYGIVRDDDYRLFLQLNANKIMDSEFIYLKKNDSCFNNACVHVYETRMDPRLFVKERENANLVLSSKILPNTFKCPTYQDYRASVTPLQMLRVSNDTKCNSK